MSETTKQTGTQILDLSSLNLPTGENIAHIPLKKLGEAEGLQITTEGLYGFAGDELREVKALLTKLDAERKSYTVPLDEAKRTIMDLFAQGLTPLQSAEGILKSKIEAYQAEEQKRREAEQARLNAEAEQERREADNKITKAEGEIQSLLKQLEKPISDAAKARIEARISELNLQISENLVLNSLVPATVQATSSKLKGVSSRSTYVAECTDLGLFLKFILDNPHFMHMVSVNEKELNAYARSTKGNVAVPGVVFEKKTSLAVKAS